MSFSEKYRGKSKFDSVDKSILDYLSDGLSAKEIACKMNMKPPDIRNRIMSMRIAKKAKNSNHLVAMFWQQLLNFVTEQPNSSN